jgi:hypothetical protein
MERRSRRDISPTACRIEGTSKKTHLAVGSQHGPTAIGVISLSAGTGRLHAQLLFSNFDILMQGSCSNGALCKNWLST